MKNKNLISSFNNAIAGMIFTFRKERNMKIHTVAAVLVLFLSLFFDFSSIERIILLLTVTLVLVCEMINTAVEIVVDIIVDVYHPKAKNAKDVAAGAVFLSALISVTVGVGIFYPKLLPLIEGLFSFSSIK